MLNPENHIMDNNAKASSGVTTVPPKEGDTRASGSKKIADLFLGLLICVAASDIIGLFFRWASYATDGIYADWVHFWEKYFDSLIWGVDFAGIWFVGLFAFLALFRDKRRKYIYRGMLILPLGTLLFFALFFGACMLMLRLW